jgi:UDP-N-acetylglucosamine/UDP-N-acetyl-alpha-D-glucosaminouronate 4-epimerase
VWLVTGAAGFIGSSLVGELLALGQLVVGLDNFSTGYERNLDDVVTDAAAARFKLIRGDIRDLDDCRSACDGVDYVLHQAALGSVPRSIEDPITSHDVNVSGFLNVFMAARDAKVSRVVYASSSSVYGDSTDVPQREDRVGRPLSPYAVTKKTNESYAAILQRTYGLKSIGLRYFNVFGARQDPNGAYAAVIPRWIDQLIAGAQCIAYGDGETSRDFCYVANVVQANLLAAAAADASATGDVYNIACGQQTSLNGLFAMLRAGLAEKDPAIGAATLEHESPRPGDIRHSLADIAKAARILGYRPMYDIARGLNEALEWYWASRAPLETMMDSHASV